jgi:hypothetical protein
MYRVFTNCRNCGQEQKKIDEMYRGFDCLLASYCMLSLQIEKQLKSEMSVQFTKIAIFAEIMEVDKTKIDKILKTLNFFTVSSSESF